MAWDITPLDAPYEIKQASILVNYLQTLHQSFILSGDFNVIPETQVVKNFDRLASNLIARYKITSTLNYKTHRVQQLFPPRLAVDYIYTSSDIKVKIFEGGCKQTLSDHLGLHLKAEV